MKLLSLILWGLMFASLIVLISFAWYFYWGGVERGVW